MNPIYDQDGNRIVKGMAVLCLGERYVVGSVTSRLIRLDRMCPQGVRKSVIVRRALFRYIQIIGYQIPLIFP